MHTLAGRVCHAGNVRSAQDSDYTSNMLAVGLRASMSLVCNSRSDTARAARARSRSGGGGLELFTKSVPPSLPLNDCATALLNVPFIAPSLISILPAVASTHPTRDIARPIRKAPKRRTGSVAGCGQFEEGVVGVGGGQYRWQSAVKQQGERARARASDRPTQTDREGWGGGGETPSNRCWHSTFGVEKTAPHGTAAKHQSAVTRLASRSSSKCGR